MQRKCGWGKLKERLVSDRNLWGSSGYLYRVQGKDTSASVLEGYPRRTRDALALSRRQAAPIGLSKHELRVDRYPAPNMNAISLRLVINAYS